jgi:hypothetical protein
MGPVAAAPGTPGPRLAGALLVSLKAGSLNR